MEAERGLPTLLEFRSRSSPRLAPLSASLRSRGGLEAAFGPISQQLFLFPRLREGATSPILVRVNQNEEIGAYEFSRAGDFQISMDRSCSNSSPWLPRVPTVLFLRTLNVSVVPRRPGDFHRGARLFIHKLIIKGSAGAVPPRKIRSTYTVARATRSLSLFRHKTKRGGGEREREGERGNRVLFAVFYTRFRDRWPRLLICRR